MNVGGISNLLFITADQWRGDCLGVRNERPVVTPNLDRLAQRSLRFDRHYVQAAPCGPSRASLHTGLYPWQHLSWHNGSKLKPHLANWALELGANGFSTGLVGYTHTANDPDFVAVERLCPRGFEGVLPGLNLVSEYRTDLKHWKRWFAARRGGVEPSWRTHSSESGYQWGEALYPFEVSDTAYIAECASRFIAEMGDYPWALHVTFFRPHDPYLVTPDFLGKQAANGDDRALPAAMVDNHPIFDTLRSRGRNKAPNNNELREIRRHYYASVAEMDAGVGLILDALSSSDSSGKTLIIVTADHGDQLGDYGLMNKIGVYDQSFHVPLIIYDPRTSDDRRGAIIDDITQGIDLFPTIMSALTQRHPGTPGRDLSIYNDRSCSDPDRVALWGYMYGDVSSKKSLRTLRAVRSKTHLLAKFDDFQPLLMDYREAGNHSLSNLYSAHSQREVVEALEYALETSRIA